MILLDTSVAIPLRDGVAAIEEKAKLAGDGGLAISAITQVELEGGVYREPADTAARRLRLDKLLTILKVLPFDESTAAIYGEIVRDAGYSRRKLLDRMIAAHALALSIPLATRNADDFSDIPGLKIELW